MPQFSIIVPVYNEATTIREILSRINAVPLDKEIVVVDDGSSDGTDTMLMGLAFANLKIIHHTSNHGKGAAFLTGLANATGEFVLIQDADLEYAPADYPQLVARMQAGDVDLVLGSRFSGVYRGLFMHQLGNKFLTWLLNRLFASSLHDYATCYKLARRKTFQELGLKGQGFDIDVEIVCNALKKKLRMAEVAVSYNPRTYRQGKKIRWLDGLWAIYYMAKYRFSR